MILPVSGLCAALLFILAAALPDGPPAAPRPPTGPFMAAATPISSIRRSTRLLPLMSNACEVAWRYSSTQASETNTTDMKTNPLIVDGVLYGLNPQLKLFALDAATGREKWVYDPVTVPQKGKNIGRGDFAASTKISRGIAFYRGSDTDQRIIYAPGGGHALYCVDALTGKLITSFGDNGIVDMHDDLDWTPPAKKLLNLENVHDFHISMTSPGVIYKDLIIVGSRLSEAALTPPGHIRAYDVHTGKRRWIFHTVPHPGEPGYESYENKDAYKWVGGANAWGGFSLDEQRGIVYTGTGSPTPDFWGGNRGGNDLYGDSTLALDAATGKLLWHFQEVQHDLWDWDDPTSPILATILNNGHKVDVTVQTTKQGFIFMFDRVTGKPIHAVNEVPVPQTKLQGEYTSPTQPVPTFFKPFVRQVLTEEDLFKDGISEESYQDLLQRFRSLDHDNMWNPPPPVEPSRAPASMEAASGAAPPSIQPPALCTSTPTSRPGSSVRERLIATVLRRPRQ